MRKYYKNMVMDLLDTLTTVNKKAREALKKENFDVIINLLADAQDVIVHITSFLSRFEEIPQTVYDELDDYNKMLFTSCQDISADNLKLLGTSLTKLKKNIKNNVDAQEIDVVFLPYNASMSDSLESIWLAANEDPNCNAYIMPIPFFDKDAHGNFAKEYYHGDYYTGDLPVLDWKKHNLEQQHPDVIFFHNPYDGQNLVSSIPPDFYSEKLKTYTDLLVYVPYFTSIQTIPETFCAALGVQNADLVFVESESIQKRYMGCFEKYFNLSRSAQKKKFVVAGSPKLDKVIHSSREDFSVPPHWEKLMTAPDGSRKKVILYNTSLGVLLQNNQNYLTKLKEVLRYFKQRDDVLLWWRPHPLTEATCQSMRPQLLMEYKKIMAQYEADGFGVLDKSYDLHRAISFSDLYYGDPSSVALMYGVGKKILIYQNISSDHMSLEIQKDDIFSQQWIAQRKENYLKRDDFVGGTTETNENGSYLLSLVIHAVKGEAEPEILENIGVLLSLWRKKLEYLAIPLEGKSGQIIYNHVKEEVAK